MKHLIFSLLFIATSLNLRGQDTIILKNNARMILDTTNMRTIPQFEEDLKLIDMKFIPSAQYDIFYDITQMSINSSSNINEEFALLIMACQNCMY